MRIKTSTTITGTITIRDVRVSVVLTKSPDPCVCVSFSAGCSLVPAIKCWYVFPVFRAG